MQQQVLLAVAAELQLAVAVAMQQTCRRPMRCQGGSK
jgi:hypothetical protein